MEHAGNTPPESPSVSQPAKEPPAATMLPVSQSRRTYFVVITLIGLAMGLLPSLFMLELDVHVIIPYEIQSIYSAQVWLFETVDFAAFLISPCLFFLILYFYGKRTVRHFNGSYLRVIPLLFFGSALGYAAFMFSAPSIDGGILVLDGTFWLEFAYGIVSEGVRDALVGFAALGLSYLMTMNLTNPAVPV